MPRYFIEVCYKGTNFNGFQIQDRGVTIQGEINKAWQILFKTTVESTPASRTDAGVHAYQNYLHIDVDREIDSSMVYNLNAILPEGIAIRSLRHVAEKAHARFDAIQREYLYFIHDYKDPFFKETSYFFPFKLDLDALNEASSSLLNTKDFTSFAKRNSDVKNHRCSLSVSHWSMNKNKQLVYHVAANRFLRGMVRGLVGTQLLVGRKRLSIEEFEGIIEAKDCVKADFSAPAHGLFLSKVIYPPNVFELN